MNDVRNIQTVFTSHEIFIILEALEMYKSSAQRAQKARRTPEIAACYAEITQTTQALINKIVAISPK